MYNNNRIGMLHYWCQKILPVAYQNSLSYMELLQKVVEKLNETINFANGLPEYIDEKIKESLDDEHLRELISEVFRTIEDAISANNEGTNTHFEHDYPNLGTLVWHDNKLYKTIRKIDNGDTIIPDVNIELVNFGDMFNDFLTEVKTRFTDNDDGDRETSSSDRPVHDLVWLHDELYEVIKPISEGNAYIYSGTNKNVQSINLDEIYDYLLDLIRSNNEAIVQESVDRENADIALQDDIDAETTARENADNTLSEKIGTLTNLNTSNKDNLVSAINEVNTYIGNEITARENADTLLGGRIDGIELDVNTNTTAINNIIAQSSLAGESNFLIVSKKGGRFTTINDAITYASTYCSEQNRVCIVIMSGVYTETITLFPNYGIDLLGVGDVTVQAEAIYPNSPLYVGGNITVENIKFLAFASSTPSYGLHVEAAAENCYLKFVNCQFTSVSTSGAGIGMHNAMELTFIDCKFISWATNSVYAHNFPGPASAVGQKIRFFGCEFQSLDANASDAVIEDATYRMGYAGVTSRMDVSFAHSIFNKGQIQYIEVNDGIITVNQPYLPISGNVRLDKNSIATLYSVDSERYLPWVNCTSYADAIGLTKIPFPSANKYEWAVQEVRNQAGTVVTSDGSINAVTEGGVTVHTPNNISQNNVYIISGTPHI